MAEWLKAAVLKTASRKSGRGFGDPEGGGGESEALHHMVYRAERTSTSYSLDRRSRVDSNFGLEGKSSRHDIRLSEISEGWPSGLRRRS